ncbi:MAG: hypothetical protein IPM35_13790 [Myxococcales bacterium]|nr:hypothetical protein [Myxococcales bacterium]
MRLGRLGIALGVTLLLGCATAEQVDDEDGVGGASAGGSTGSGGKVDNPGGGGSGNAGSGGEAGSSGASSGGASSGGTSSGGASSGGASSGGTSSGGTSSGGTSSGGAGGSCAAGKKMCASVCIAPSPGVGCLLQDNQCTPCPNPPPNGTSTCAGTLCDFTCNAGYTKSGNSCIGSGGGGAPAGGGGSTGSGGSSGCAAPCNPSDITSQFLCTFYCASQTGNPGICAPIVNCCACP